MEITMIFYDFIGLFKTMFSVGEGGGAGQCKSVGLSLRSLQSGEGGQIPSMQSASWGGVADLRPAKADGGIADLRSAIGNPNPAPVLKIHARVARSRDLHQRHRKTCSWRFIRSWRYF